MKKFLVLILSGLLVMSLSAGAAWAKPDNAKKEEAKAKVKAMQMYKAQYKAMANGKVMVKSEFKDTANHWGNGSIQRMSALGLFAGYDDGSFKPNNNINQAEMIALLMRLADSDGDEDDVDDYNDELDGVPVWAKDSVRKAAHLKIMSLNRFHSAQQASRAQTCIAFGKLLEKEGYIDLDDFDLDPDNLPFVDGKLLLGNDDLVYIVAMYRAGYVKGAPGNKFLPNNAITRAEMAAILERILDDLKEDMDEEDEDELSGLESDLLDDYDKIGAVSVSDVKLDGDEDEVAVEVEVDLDSEEDEWADLKNSDIESWMEDLVGDIQDELSKNTRVDGKIINIDDDKVLVKFIKNGTGSLLISYKDDDYRGSDSDVDDVEEELRGAKFNVNNRVYDIEFKIKTINYYEDDEEIVVYLKAQEDDASDLWDVIDSSDIEDDVEIICQEIAEAFLNDTDAEPEMIYISFYDENSAKLASYEYDVAEDSLE